MGEVIPVFGIWAGPAVVLVTLGLREPLFDGGWEGDGGDGVAEGADPFLGAGAFTPIPGPTVPIDLLLVLTGPVARPLWIIGMASPVPEVCKSGVACLEGRVGNALLLFEREVPNEM